MKTTLIKLQDKFIFVSDEKEQVQLATWYYEPDNNTPIYQFTKETLPEQYYLKKIIAGIPELPLIDFSLLSEEDCKTIGWVDVEKLAIEDSKDSAFDYCQMPAFKRGFKTAQSLNDKMFSLEDIDKAIEYGHESEIPFDKNIYNKFIQSLQQTSWEIEIEMECAYGNKCPSKGAYDKQHLCKIQPKITNNSIKLIKIL